MFRKPMASRSTALKPVRRDRDKPSRSAARTTAGAKRAPVPGFIEPSHPTLRERAPSGADWIHEIKFDGYRAQAHLRDGRPFIYTRAGHNWTDRFQPIADALAALAARDLILDGEAVVADMRGVADFGLLHAALAAGDKERILYYAFDLLYLDGLDLREAPLTERKRLLAELLAGAPAHILYAEHLEGDGPEVLARACGMGLEGIVSKQRDAAYRSGRVESWVKVKCGKRDAFPIVAFVEKLGAKPRKIASLYVGRREGGEILYAGKVRSGYTEAAARELRERLDPLIQKRSPLSRPVDKPKATWVEPVLEAEVAYGAMTGNGLLREAVFKGVREDRAQLARPSLTSRRAGARGVPPENILQLLPDAVPPSEEQLTAYWTKVWKRALPHLGRRPLKLVRHVKGTTFYHMGRLPPLPRSVHSLTIEKREGGEGTRLWVDDLAGLLGLVEIGAVELHAWNAGVEDIEHPDRLVFDLDPGDGVAWEFVIETALSLRALLQAEGLKPWPKLTGGKGLHLMAPIAGRIDHDEARRYAKKLAQKVAASAPDRYTLAADPRKRRGRIFIDYLRNGRGTTAVGAWSPRARPGFPIAAPVSWRQVEQGIRPDAFSMNRLPRR
jgi:bifunctional non-homologous end joining protein LigD